MQRTKSAIVSMIAILLCSVLGCEQKQEVEVPPVNANFQWNRSLVAVTNKDDFTWTNVKFTVKCGAFGFYDAHVINVGAGETVNVSLANFTDAGSRFDPNAQAPEHFLISVRDAQGHERSGAWKLSN